MRRYLDLQDFLVKACAFVSLFSAALLSADSSIPVSAQGLSLKEKIGQLFVVPAAELLGEPHMEALKKLIQQECVGGVILKQGTVEGQRAFIARLQELAPFPLLCLQDAEWGVAMRLFDVPAFPKNLTLGAVQDLSLLYRLGQEIGRQCAYVGARLNLAPVVDVNSNPHNPIIHMRSFGEDPVHVAACAKQVSLGMQSVGALSCAKHFPGHGDVSVDPHLSLPCVSCSQEAWGEIHLLPFQSLIRSGVDAVLSAHLCVEGLRGQPFQVVPFSRDVITGILRNQWHFEGLVISDALNMQALASHYLPGKIAVGALGAGHDLLLYGDHIAPNIEQILRVDVPCAMRAIEEAVLTGQISKEELDEHVERILAVKRKIASLPPVDVNPFFSPQAEELTRCLFEEAVTVVGSRALIPISSRSCALIEWGSAPVFVSALTNALHPDCFSIEDPDLQEKLQRYARVVLVLSNHTQFDFSAEKQALLQKVAASSSSVVAVVLGTPYVVGLMPRFPTVVIAYENVPLAQQAAAKVLLGQLPPRGRLPVSLPPYFKIGEGCISDF